MLAVKGIPTHDRATSYDRATVQPSEAALTRRLQGLGSFLTAGFFQLKGLPFSRKASRSLVSPLCEAGARRLFQVQSPCTAAVSSRIEHAIAGIDSQAGNFDHR